MSKNTTKNPLRDILKEECEGKTVIIRYPGGAVYLAHLEEVGPVDLLLKGAMWVTYTGRYGLLVQGKPDDQCEWEPTGETTVVQRAHAEVSPWPHELPTEAK